MKPVFVKKYSWYNLVYWIKHKLNKQIDIKEIAKIYSREGFLKITMKEKAYMFYGRNCPSCHGLKPLKCTDKRIGSDVCEKCWREAVKDIKFKGDDKEGN